MREDIKTALQKKKYTWLITGVAGFIGSNLLESLLTNNQCVIGIDNFETGHQDNIDDVKQSVSSSQWKNFTFHEIDIFNYTELENVFNDVDFVLHQAALGSVPRSISDPKRTNEVNISGFLNILNIAKENLVKGFIFATSSSVYGDHKTLPKKENCIGNPLSPYAITKLTNELYAKTFSEHYGFKSVGLRYFNVFGKRQDPHGAYAAVVPRWIKSMIDNNEIYINGDGSTTRDFCYIENAIDANILSALKIQEMTNNFEVMNIAVGESNNLNKLFELIYSITAKNLVRCDKKLSYRDFRAGDIKDSLADISKAKKLIDYYPRYNLKEGLKECIPWYIKN